LQVAVVAAGQEQETRQIKVLLHGAVVAVVVLDTMAVTVAVAVFREAEEVAVQGVEAVVVSPVPVAPVVGAVQQVVRAVR
jgi:hypothetical protein